MAGNLDDNQLYFNELGYLSAYHYGADTSSALYVSGYKNRGTGTSPSHLLDGDDITKIRALTQDSSLTWGSSAELILEAGGNHSDTSRPTQFSVRLTPSGSTALYTAFNMDYNGAMYTTVGNNTSTSLYPAYSARAWINFDPSPLAIRQSKNVASIATIATNGFRITFSTGMPYSNYCIVTATNRVGDYTEQALVVTAATTYCDIYTKSYDGGADGSATVCVAVFA